MQKDGLIFLADEGLVGQLNKKLSAEAVILTAGSQGWLEALQSFNKDSENQTPSIYVKCASQNDVVESIKFARANNLQVTPRSGRHNLGNFSLLNGGLIIDVQKLKNISHSKENSTVTYQTGCRFGQVDAYIDKNLPGYTWVSAMDPSIGTAGARCALGVGWLQRWLGNGIDNIVSVKVVLADGRIVEASKDTNSDLLMGIRGAGSNFGIVTQITEKMHYVLDPQQGKEVLFSSHFFDIEVAQELYDEILPLTIREDFPDQMFLLPVLQFFEGKRGLHVLVAHYKYDAELKEIKTEEHWTETELRKLIVKYKGRSMNEQAKVNEWNYISHQDLQQGMKVPWGSGFYPFGGFVSDANAKEVTSSLISHWKNSDIPEFSKKVPFHSTSLYQFGGKIQRSRNPEDSAWPGNKDTQLLTVTWGGWLNPEDKGAMISWVKDQWSSLYKKLQFGYICAASFDWKSSSYAEFVYGSNYEKLRLLKGKYDPDNIFRHNVNIPPKQA